MDRGHLALLLLPLLAVVGTGCDETPLQGPGTLVVELDHVVVDGSGTQPLQMNQQSYTNAAGNNYSVTRFEYVVSDFSLTAPSTARQEGDFHTDGPHYRTEQDPGTRSIMFEDVPSGDYSALEFVFGIVGSKNMADAYPALDAAGMGWPPQMGGGYHYMRMEGNYGTASSFTTHTGPSMGVDRSIPVSLPVDISIEQGRVTTVRLIMDLNEWYQSPFVYDFDDYGAIMGNAAAQDTLQQNGADAWSVAEVTQTP